jgi:glutaminase
VTDRLVSSGALPRRLVVQEALDEAREMFGADDTGALSTVYPALASADPSAFGLCVVGVSGEVASSGAADQDFTIMSVAKPFVFALACEMLGVDDVRRRVGVNATGLAFNSAQAIEQSPDGRTNPMVNAGAIATTGLVGDWDVVRDGLSAFAGRPLELDEAVLASALETNHRNRGLANMLAAAGAVTGDPGAAVETYTRQSCLAVTAADLAVMGATLADGGTNPVTGVRVVDPETAHATLAVMTIAGMYETSGDWLFDVGMPGKSGISGGVLTVSPGKGALATYAPLLDDHGNSVRGSRAAAYLARRLGLDLLASQPVAP